MARNGSGIYENQHNLVKTARNFDASPIVTTGMPQDPYFGSKREVFQVGSASFGPDFPTQSSYPTLVGLIGTYYDYGVCYWWYLDKYGVSLYDSILDESIQWIKSMHQSIR